MKFSAGFVSALCLLGLAYSGCSKKETAPPNAERAPSPGDAASPSSEAALADHAPAGADSTAATQSADKGGAHPDLAAADVAYEAWFKKYGLDLNDPKMLDADPDGDGFTNEEEFLAGTNPLDPNSHPAVHKGMKMKEFTKVELPFVLRSVEGDTAQIERSEGGAKHVESVKAGQAIKNSPYRVTTVKSQHDFDKDGHPIDVSHVTLEDSGNKQKVDLVKDLAPRSGASYAVLNSPDGTQTMTVHQGDNFAWPNDPNIHYVVKDLREEQVILEQQDTHQMWTVRKQ